MYDTQAVIDEFGVHPSNMVLYRSFTGDKSDNIPGVTGIGPKTILKLIPEIVHEKQVTLEELFEKSNQLLTETKKYQKILDNRETLIKNWQLMDIKLLDISANVSSKIRGIMSEPVSALNRAEFQRLFYEDKMWAVMKNLPDWLTRTWLSLDAYAKQTHK